MLQLIISVFFGLIYLNNESESYVLNYNTSLEIVLTNSTYPQNKQTVKDVESLQMAECRCNNGDCVKKNGVTECQCWPEYGIVNGNSTNCRACNCGKESNCTIKIHWLLRDEINCICKEGYKVENQTCVVGCPTNYCLNGGTCKVDQKKLKCDCKESYSGDKCETQTCNPKRCKHGQCEFKNSISICRCDDGYSGLHCDIEVLKEPDSHAIKIALIVLSSISIPLLLFCMCLSCKYLALRRRSNKSSNVYNNAIVLQHLR